METEELIQCRECKQDLPLSSFVLPLWRQGKICKKCFYAKHQRPYKQRRYAETPPEVRAAKAKDYSTRRFYGISGEEYRRWIASANGICQLCDQASERLYLDHCEETGLIRGVLCLSCNWRLIGMMEKAGPELVAKAVKWLERD